MGSEGNKGEMCVIYSDAYNTFHWELTYPKALKQIPLEKHTSTQCLPNNLTF